ncbi:MAG: CBS domain-containing protein [Chloroflexi bacterium]|nr:CBS domain-containing protein [Chloroflexota bacterium]MBT3671130.1 CBS domain-containing protein [Chloroflexota bacterium]MBT4004401.1 CBS domain-containing protein [Chloroflexota bacterium]MBT4304411.1 CBS domain-containing protein [Chloroflexota bacterium]MBT4534430.1 CBS domain-containing protein [Chloroflexota bacterium]
MHILLTHEQADFDAIASLLGAHLLEVEAIAVLPRKLNRNVRAFLTLYGAELPFTDPVDLPKGNIEGITLVDTQSLITIKGMMKKTKINVIDHHEVRSDLSKEWHLNIEKTGAATTLLVEGIQERDLPLTMVQATLLLLGIYEDTGALTYSRTVSRDARAAAYLLEKGASLQIARDFLNHPLSPEQQEIYSQLKDSIETHSIQGSDILLATGDAGESTEEISSIVHKLRDLLDPDAVIVLITTAAGVQLVARATTDQVNVGEIAKHFGGGGHRRASAALIRGQELDDVQSELLKILPEFIRPIVTVAEIMSRGPQLLSPDTPVVEVAEQMRRYGYEGYPIVKNGKVKGLITRRAVDRTLAHKLNLKAKDIMKVGNSTILPTNSIEDLQKEMTDTGWGQIPVIDPKTEEIIGIVTRTDLLKILTPEVKGNGIHNISDRLEARLSPSRLAILKATAEIAQKHHQAVYIVGGFVRDLILDRPSQDYDLVIEGDAIALGDALVKEFGGRVISHKRFGTAKWQIAKIADELAKVLEDKNGQMINASDFPEFLDLVSARREFYSAPTVLPTVERGSIKLDLHRRDFTINTLALRLDGNHYGELHDYWGGMDDLNQGLLRVLHSLSFVDDPTRILRAVRFEKRFDYEIEPRTLELLENALQLLDKVSGDRIRHELSRILQEGNSMPTLHRLESLGVLSAIHPDLIFNSDIEKRIVLKDNTPSDKWEFEPVSEQFPVQLAIAYSLWLHSLPKNSIASIAKRLKLPAALTKIILGVGSLTKNRDEILGNSPGKQTMTFEEVNPLALYGFYLVVGDKKIRKAIDQYMSEWRSIKPSTSGHDLRLKNIPPGPKYHEVLTALRIARINGDVTSDNEEKKLLEKLLND